MTSFSAKKLFVVCALAFVALFASVNNAFATHFRYGHITWRIPNPTTQKNVVEIRFEMAFRRSYFSPVPAVGPPPTTQNVGAFYIYRLNSNGSVAATVYTGNVLLTTTQVYPADDYFIGVYTFTYAFPANTGQTNYQIYYNGCCTISTLLDNNHDLDYVLTSTVPLNTLAATPVNLGSPVSSSLPVTYVIQNRPVSQAIPMADPDGDAVSIRLATLTESLLNTQAPHGSPAFTVSPTGVVTWTPTTVGLYVVELVLSDAHGATSMLEFVYQVLAPVGSPPTLTVNGSSTPVTMRIPVGYAISIPLVATDPDPVAPITIGAGFLPSTGFTTPALPAVLTPTAPNAPVTSTFRWTPSLADAGPHVFVFSATDNNYNQTTNSLTVIVDQTIGLYVSGIIRDFTGTTPDFARAADGDNAPTQLVVSGLSASSKPMLNPAATPTTVASAASFANWWSGNGQVLTLGLLNSSTPHVYSFNSTAFGQPSHTYFTFEAHSFYTYSPGDILNFSSSDDLWVFINGILAVDLGGVHAAPRSMVLDVDAMAAQLNVVAGATYHMDIFYAHRSSTHAASLGVSATQVAICDPTSTPVATALPSRAGTALANADGSTQLVGTSSAPAAGAAWTNSRLPIVNGFTAEFDFTMSPAAAGDGLAFVLQDASATALGSNGAGLGYAGIAKSLAVELDTHQDALNTDPAFDQVSIQSRFDQANSAAETSSLGSSASGAAVDLNDGASHHVRVTYTPDPAGTMFLRVYLNQAAAATVEVALTQASMLQAFTSGLAYVGF